MFAHALTKKFFFSFFIVGTLKLGDFFQLIWRSGWPQKKKKEEEKKCPDGWMDGWMDPQLLLPQVVLPADGLALSIVPRGSEPSRDGRRTRVIFSPSPVSGLQSHRDERACRHRSGICASRERARGVRAAASGPCAAPEGSAPPAGGGRSSEQKRQVHVLNGCVQSFKNKTTLPKKS